MRGILLTLLLLPVALAAPGSARAAVSLQKVADFDSPLYVAAAPEDYHRLYVVEQSGTVRVVKDGAKLAAPFLQLTDLASNGERGLLSIAFPPDFQRSRFVYAYYNRANGNVRVDQFRATNPDHVDAGYQRTVLEIGHQAAPNHNGGTARFGPDGFLYLAPGDGGSGQSANAQNRASLLGKMLRIRPHAGGGYGIPPGNPFAGQAGGRAEIWAYGFRNPFRFSFDRATGDLAIGDVGESTTEEIDFAPAASGRGRGVNYGWNVCEGSSTTGTKDMACPLGARPVIDKFASDGWHAITGGVVVRDRSLPSLYGRYLYGDTYLNGLRSALLRLPRAADDRPAGLSVSSLAGIGEDTAGCVYVASLTGPVFRVVENTNSVPCPDRVRPRLKVRVKRRQRVLRRRRAIAYARCSERSRVHMTGRLRIGHRSYRLRGYRRSAAAHRRVRLRVRLTRRARRALRRALRHHRRARVRVFLRARDRAGNRSRLVRRTVRVRR
ncbi:MAG: sorbosone dehydrogenase family protein [Thermoleophilaceae bacterium]